MKISLIVIEDEQEVREALKRDLKVFAGSARIELCEDAEDAWQAVEEISQDGDILAIALCDHRLPGRSGVDFLCEMMQDQRTKHAKKVLVTGQADQQDTIRAINEAKLDHYIAKPWDAKGLVNVVRTLLTEYVIENDIDALPHMKVLDQAAIQDAIRQGSE